LAYRLQNLAANGKQLKQGPVPEEMSQILLTIIEQEKNAPIGRH
jgi:hypothetical protein